MKMNLMQVKSFLTFDLSLDNRYISEIFNITHNHFQSAYPSWSLKATYKKLAARYWFWYVLTHFATLYALAVVATLPFNTGFNQFYLAAILTVGIISFIILSITQYGPSFFSDFLPKLETITAEFENRQSELLKDQLQKGLKTQFSSEFEKLSYVLEKTKSQQEQPEALQNAIPKCRREQFHTFSLVLIYYVFDKTSGLNAMQCNDNTARLLTKLFGKDPGGIKDGLKLILGKKEELPARKRTEIRNQFNDVYVFFEKLQFSEGIQTLRTIESKFMQ
jgi:hypothetical protein